MVIEEIIILWFISSKQLTSVYIYFLNLSKRESIEGNSENPMQSSVQKVKGLWEVHYIYFQNIFLEVKNYAFKWLNCVDN